VETDRQSPKVSICTHGTDRGQLFGRERKKSNYYVKGGRTLDEKGMILNTQQMLNLAEKVGPGL